jgi:hypothetical protein
MTVAIQANIYRDAVKRDHGRLVPANVWSIDQWGFVTVGTPTTVAGQLLAEIAMAPGLVRIVGSEGNIPVPSNGNLVRLSENAGHAYFDPTKQGVDAEITIVYDTSDNYESGYFVFGENNVKIDYPLHISLAHELSHAKQVLDGAWTTAPAGEVFAVNVENTLRRADSPPLPSRVGHDGGRKDPPKGPPPPPPKSGCLVLRGAGRRARGGRMFVPGDGWRF